MTKRISPRIPSRRWLRFRLEYEKLYPEEWYPEGQRNYAFRLDARLRDAREILHAGGECLPRKGGFSCGIDCDGGGVSFTRRPDNSSILMRFEPYGRLRMTIGCGDEEIDTYELMPGTDDKVFRLDKVDAAECRSMDDGADGGSME